MKVYKHIDEFGPAENPVVTTGTFDGVHLGHQQIIRRLKETAERTKGETVLLTFFPHPRMVLFPDYKPLLLNTQEEKISLLEKAGIDHLIIHPFTREFSMLSSIEFISGILVKKLHTKKLVIGHDHHFGKNREGSFNHLKEFGPIYGFEV
ncbi:MAG TPA: adenylyltransferase/cytidyltransferase family protein, partial [Bacteroidia bacterium]|nr:adenylyltransferase/cytidyltransferase family protein [Bacteroidia bacterium]